MSRAGAAPVPLAAPLLAGAWGGPWLVMPGPASPGSLLQLLVPWDAMEQLAHAAWTTDKTT